MKIKNTKYFETDGKDQLNFYLLFLKQLNHFYVIKVV